MPSFNSLGRMNRDYKYNRRAFTVIPFRRPSPPRKYLIQEVYVNLLETLSATFSIYNLPPPLWTRLCPLHRCLQPAARNIIETSCSVGVNSLQEVTDVCVSMLQWETTNSKSAWLLVTDIDKELFKAFFISACAKRLPDWACWVLLSPTFFRSPCYKFFTRTFSVKDS